jgi:hypothetical protein
MRGTGWEQWWGRGHRGAHQQWQQWAQVSGEGAGSGGLGGLGVCRDCQQPDLHGSCTLPRPQTCTLLISAVLLMATVTGGLAWAALSREASHT